MIASLPDADLRAGDPESGLVGEPAMGRTGREISVYLEILLPSPSALR